MSTVKSRKNTPVIIVEDHHEVVPHIHRNIASKYLPFSDMTLVHFDSHPDMLIPVDMKADTVFDKAELYDTMSIENWIVPLVYAGHVSCVYWLKPPWCEQIQDGEYTFYVGRCSRSGTIRTTCKESYFVSETLYTKESNLEDKKLLTLHVLTLVPEKWDQLDNLPTSEQCHSQVISLDKEHAQCREVPDIGPRARKRRKTGENESPKHNSVTASVQRECLGKESLQKDCSANENLQKDCSANNSLQTDCLVNESLQRDDSANENLQKGSTNESLQKDCSANVDLQEDCSTNESPPKSLLTKQSHQNDSLGNNSLQKDNISALRKCLYSQLEKLAVSLEHKHFILDIDLDFYSTKNPFQEMYTAEQMCCLRQLYKYQGPVGTRDEVIQKCVEDRTQQLKEIKTAILMSSTDSEAEVDLDEQRLETVRKLVSSVKQTDPRADFELLHEAGCTMDDTDLPHHVSTEKQICALVQETKHVLETLPRPALITLSRSSVDDYCPPDQVDYVEEAVCLALEEVYVYTDVQRFYTDSGGEEEGGPSTSTS